MRRLVSKYMAEMQSTPSANLPVSDPLQGTTTSMSTDQDSSLIEVQRMLAQSMAQVQENAALLKSLKPQLDYISGESDYTTAKPDFPITSVQGLEILEHHMETNKNFKKAVVSV